ncbi:MAG: ribosome assembly factor SBDS [Candidatus Hadarchaeales archaeon]
MVRLEDAVVARISLQGSTFEILVDPELALKIRSGELKDVKAAMAVEKIFKDVKKGDAASEEAMKKIFGTTDPLKVAEEIIKRGEVQITTEQRRRMREERLRQIVAIISRRAINPQTGLPHPPARIEAAIAEARVPIEEFRSAEEQVPRIMKEISAIIPLKLEMRNIAVKVPVNHVGKVRPVLGKFGTVKKEEWLQDGSWAVLVEIPAGIQIEFFEKLNELTKGEVVTKVVK